MAAAGIDVPAAVTQFAGICVEKMDKIDRLHGGIDTREEP